MQIKQAFTYGYEQEHFGKNLEHVTVASECFKNVKNYCKTYKELGRNVRVSLVMGLRAWDSGTCTYGYHYLVKDADTGQYSDPQYSRYTFVELHSWTPEEYEQECKMFEHNYDGHPAEEFAFYYVELYQKQLRAALKFIKTNGWSRLLSDKAINEYVSLFDEQLTAKPEFGKTEVALFNIH